MALHHQENLTHYATTQYSSVLGLGATGQIPMPAMTVGERAITGARPSVARA